MKRINITSVFLIFSFLVLVSTGSQAGDIQRSCGAYYEIERAAATVPPPSPPVVGAETIMVRLGYFSARGSCGGKRVANRCRERARDAAHRCMADHWAVMSGVGDRGTAPCGGGSIVNYPISNEYLKGTIRDWICATFRATTMDIRVKGVTTGDTGCPKTSVLASSHRIQCGR